MLPLGSADLLSLVTTTEDILWNPRSNVFQLTKTLASTYRVNSFTSSSHLLHPVEQTPSTKSTLSTIFSKAVNCFILLIRNRGHNSTQLLPFLHNYFLHIKVFFEKSLKVSFFYLAIYQIFKSVFSRKNETLRLFYKKTFYVCV